MVEEVRAPPQWTPAILKEAAARHNPAFSHFRGGHIHQRLPDLDLPTHNESAVHIFVPHDTAPKARDGTARVTKHLASTTIHYDTPPLKVMVTHKTGRDNYCLHATHKRSPISIYKFTIYCGLQSPQRHPGLEWRHPLHIP